MSLRLLPKKSFLSPDMRRMIRLAIALCAAFTAYWGVNNLPADKGQARIIDGDTIEISTRRVRLYGIDAPEIRQFCTLGTAPYACGETAREALQNLVAGEPVTCKERDIDRYNRSVAICYVRNVEINDWMVRQGYAVAYRRYATRYIEAEEEAKAAKRGLWNGRFEFPWDYRHNKS